MDTKVWSKNTGDVDTKNIKWMRTKYEMAVIEGESRI